MIKGRVSIAKINPPRLSSSIFPRKRLFHLLDKCLRLPAIWIAAPGGAGKTTVVASYIKARKLPCLWYQIDAGDGDIASFFHYMGLAAKQAAPHKKKPLPHLTLEYLSGLQVFTRNFFRELFTRLKIPSVIVLDNYQEAPVDSPLHEVLLNGLSEIPDGINIIIIGRLPLPPAMARLRASDAMSMLDWEDIRLAVDESIGIGRLRMGNKLINKEAMEALHEQTQGWAAGLVLLLEQEKEIAASQDIKNYANQQALFDYFAGEIFNRIDKETQDFLLKTAFLPKIEAEAAEKLTGLQKGERILNNLIQRNYFTVRHPAPASTYEYHPLFRQFLLSRASEVYTPSELKQIQSKAAKLLEAIGYTEDAVALLQDAGEWEGALNTVLSNARTMVEQGRSLTLEKWIRNFPKDILNNTPWLIYWLGACRMSANLIEAGEFFGQAFKRFKAQQDAAGAFLAWAGAVETFVYQWGDFKPLDGWIAEIEALLLQYPEFPSPEIEVRITAGIFTALMYRQPQHKDLPLWSERLQQLLEKTPDTSLRILAGMHLLFYYTWWVGDIGKATRLINMLKPLTHATDLPPLIRIVWCAMQAAYYRIMGDHATAIRSAEEGMKVSQDTGVHLYDFFLLAKAISCKVAVEDLPAARLLLENMKQKIGSSQYLALCLYHWEAFTEAVHSHDVFRMLEHSADVLHRSREAGVPWAEGILLTASAYAHFANGKYDAASEAIKSARQIAMEIQSKTIEFGILQAEAEFALNQGNETACINALQEAFSLALQQGFVYSPFWPRRMLACHCVKALEHNIEVEYIQNLIRTRNLFPEEAPLHLDNWPWPLKIYTLGQLEIFKNDKPLRFSGRVQQKPLELLKLLIALGGKEVSSDIITDTLWPNAEGDAAQNSLEITLHRLRKLLGENRAIIRQEDRLTISRRYIWVDIWAKKPIC